MIKGKNSLNEAAEYMGDVDAKKLNDIQNKFSNFVYAQLDELNEQMTKLNKVVNEAAHFERSERNLRIEVTKIV
jgi:hypothetical protein